MPKGKKDLEVEFTCPLGSECEEIRDNKIYRCMWYTKLVGDDPNTGELIEDWSCAISWMPTLQIEMSKTNRGQTEALESFRNETVKGQAEFNKLITMSKTNNLGHK
jgi:hypothetical protein